MSVIQKMLLAVADCAASVARPIMNRVARAQAHDIHLELQRVALASTAEHVRRHMLHAKAMDSKLELLAFSLKQADLSGDRLVCEFGVFTGATINHIASLTSKTVFGFDSFEGLPEAWNYSLGKGHFAVAEPPAVRQNVTLVKGWFNESLPKFLSENGGKAGFIHVDCDLYSSTKIVFDLLGPRMEPGTVMVFDEYFNYPGWENGEHKALTEFLVRTGMECKFIGYHRKDQQVAVVLTRGARSGEA